MKRIAKLLSANGPLGPVVAGILGGCLFILGFAIVAPPILWTLNTILPPWWAYWGIK